jgi:large subunit ribosomal protein L13
MKTRNKKIKRETHVIDAKDKSLGRLASEIAILLQGKHKPEYAPYKDIGDFVIVKNFSKVRFTGKKLRNKKYFRHSGYLGGLKEITLEELFKKDPFKVLRRAVLGMLPKNKLRSKMIKRLSIQER